MREVLPGYYEPTTAQIRRMWRDGTFAFDANVLLGLYRYSPKTRDLMLKLFDALSERLWLPHQAALEYQRGRKRVISDQQHVYRSVEDAVDRALSGLRKELKPFEERHPYIVPGDILAEVEKARDRIKASLRRLRKQHPDYMKKDSIRRQLDKLLNGKVGANMSAEDRHGVYAEAKRRIELREPPGYADAAKEGSFRYGDVVLWLQLLEHAETTKKPIIFTTDDVKEDWWENVADVRKPRPELAQEMQSVAHVRFWMYDTREFMREGQDFLKVATQDETNAAVQEVNEVQTRARPLDASLAIASLARVFDSAKWLEGIRETLASRPLIDPKVLEALATRPVIDPMLLESLAELYPHLVQRGEQESEESSPSEAENSEMDEPGDGGQDAEP